MNKIQAIRVLKEWDKKGRYIFTNHELAKLFPEDSRKALIAGLERLVKSGLLQRACRSIYINKEAHCFDSYAIERITKTLRAGQYNYVSLESALSEYGVISQVPIDRLTVMTTGREGIYKTPYGVIEFTHTKRSVADILQNTLVDTARPLRIATKKTAWRDLKRTGRNINLANLRELNDE